MNATSSTLITSCASATARFGRVVATVLDATAVPLGEHRFAPTDLLLFGSEGRGLPSEVVAASSVAVTIPVHGRTQSLNLVVALGIVLFERKRQLGGEAHLD